MTFRSKLTLLLIVSLLICTSCGNDADPKLQYDDVLGYNLYEFIGLPKDTVLKAIIKKDIDISDIGAERGREGYEYQINSKKVFNSDSSVYFSFYEFGEPQQDRLLMYSERIYLESWPDPSSQEGELLVQTFLALSEKYGDPDYTQGMNVDPDHLLTQKGSYLAKWNREDDLGIDFSINPSGDDYTALFWELKYYSISGNDQTRKDAGLDISF